MINFLVNICFAVSLVGFILGVVGLLGFRSLHADARHLGGRHTGHGFCRNWAPAAQPHLDDPTQAHRYAVSILVNQPHHVPFGGQSGFITRNGACPGHQIEKGVGRCSL